MIISTIEEYAQYIPNQAMHNIDNIVGFMAISEDDFLSVRVGRKLMEAIQQHYNNMHPVLTTDQLEADDPNRPWHELILLCQPVVAFDVEYRSADIRAISVNQGGINIAETVGYDIAPDQKIEKYKSSNYKEAHGASNRLLMKLEEWQRLVSTTTSTTDGGDPSPSPSDPDTPNSSLLTPNSSPTPTTDGGDPSPSPSDPDTPNSSLLTPHSQFLQELRTIVTLWQQSAYYYYVQGLLFSTAMEFNSYIDIYESREKFITLVPDIRYCQEVYIEAEIGDELLQRLITGHRNGTLSTEEGKAFSKLQRTLSLYVEARAPMFKSRAQQARDEATGHMALTLRYMRTHHIFDPIEDTTAPSNPNAPTPPPPPCPKHPSEHIGIADHITHCHCHHRSAWLTSSLI